MPAITDVTELQAMENDLDGDYWLAHDIDASGVEFTPIGLAAPYFTGTLDGKLYKVTNLTMSRIGAGSQHGGLIYRSYGTVENVGIEDCDISVESTNQGAFAAALVVDNNTGGIVRNCYSTGVITVTGDLPGLYASDASGLVMFNWATIDNCYSSVAVTLVGRDAYAGGLVAYNFGTVDESYATGHVEADARLSCYSGGFVAVNDGGVIRNCYSRGDSSAEHTTGSSFSGGFVAYNDDGDILNCYSTGIPTALTTTGGFCALNDDAITACFWDTETSGEAASDGGTGKTTAEIKTRATFLDWDFVTIWALCSASNSGYPCLLGVTPDCTSLSGRATNPIQDKPTLELIRNVEMAARGRFFVDEEGNAVYKSRYARNA